MELRLQLLDLATRTHFASILEEANIWQKKRGSEGWNYAFDDAWLLPRIERSELYLGYLQKEPVATCRILFEDAAYWGERETGDSIYLHTLAVCRKSAGLGIAEALIEHVVDMGRQRGLEKIRLDCFLANTPLVAFYERIGFASVGSILINGKMLNLMERPIAGILA